MLLGFSSGAGERELKAATGTALTQAFSSGERGIFVAPVLILAPSTLWEVEAVTTLRGDLFGGSRAEMGRDGADVDSGPPRDGGMSVMLSLHAGLSLALDTAVPGDLFKPPAAAASCGSEVDIADLG